MREQRPPRSRGETPRFAPVVYDDLDDPDAFEDDVFDEPPRGGRGDGDDDGGWRGGGSGGYASDAGLFRVLALIAVLGVVIVALVLPWSPISVFGGGDDGDEENGVRTSARSDVPALPPGLVAMSDMYDVEGGEGLAGPWTLEVRLHEAIEDPRNLAYYTHEDGRWVRLVSVAVSEDGMRAGGTLDQLPGSIVVLRREALAGSLGALINAGDTIDPAAASSATEVAVRAATLAAAGDGSLDVDPAGLEGARRAAGGAPVYLGVTGGSELAAGVIAAPESRAAHVDAIVAAVAAQGADGAYVDYLALPAAARAEFTALVQELADRLGEDAGLIVGVPVSDPQAGGYDWSALLEAADALWLRPSDDVTVYYQQVEALLAAQREAGLDLQRVSLMLPRHSIERSPTGLTRITQRGALTAASAVDRGIDGGISTGDPVTLRAVNLQTDPRGPALRWDDATRMVTFSYAAPDGERVVWIENRFSAAYRMEVAQRHGLGGVVVDSARTDPTLADIWEDVIAFVEAGDVHLERPYGPYLVPCWQASGGALEGAEECWSAVEPAEAVVWRAPEQPGAYEIRLIVSDGTVFVGQELALNVTGAAEAPVEPTPAPPAEEPVEEPIEEPVEEPIEEPVEEPVDEPIEEPEVEEPEAEEPADLPFEEPDDETPPGPGGVDPDE